MTILTIFTGGTIACSRTGGVLSPDGGNSYLLLDLYRQTDNAVAFETAQPYFILSETLSPAHWERLYNCIKSHDWSRFDGVIVTHGTDTLPYTAAYLGLRLGLCEKPVVLVSANYPLTDSRSNGLSNFTGAVDFIRSGGKKGVFVSYQNTGEPLRIHRATRVLLQKSYSDDVVSVHDGWFATVEHHQVTLNPAFSDDEPALPSVAGDGRVLWLRAHPGMVYPEPVGCKAVLLEGYHSGTLNTDSEDLKAFCEQCRQLSVPVFLTGSEEGFDYQSKQAFEALGIRVLPSVSPVTAYVGLHLVQHERKALNSCCATAIHGEANS